MGTRPTAGQALTTPDNRGKQREKLLERELEKLAGSNWQVRVQITLVLRQSGPSTSTDVVAPCPLPPRARVG